MSSAVDHPQHYTSGAAACSKCGHPIECIDVVRHLGFNVGNAIKYLWRLGKKDAPTQELKKAAWYIADEIKRVETSRVTGEASESAPATDEKIRRT